MDIALETIQDLAPDQASLNAAKKLLKPAKWPVRGQAPTHNTIWGECQGSGANPYYTVADVVEHGYKCTCPSRKFPCKHVLALLWQFSEGPEGFTEGEQPQWVEEWQGRRRKGGNTATKAAPKTSTPKNINDAEAEPKATELSPEEAEKKAAARAKAAARNKAHTEKTLRTGLEAFQQWIDDQLRTGLSTFLKDPSEHCRAFSARLVDAKATELAARVDELSARLHSLSPAEQVDAALMEMGKWVLLSQAWLNNPEDRDAHRAIASAESQEKVLEHPDSPRSSGQWVCLGEQIFTRRDGLISHSTWLLNLSAASAQYAMLQDYYPASAGRREAGLGVGSQFEGELVYYPSRQPLRGFVQNRQALTPAPVAWSLPDKTLTQSVQQHLLCVPWADRSPYIFSPGQILRHRSGQYWWSDGQQHIALSNRDLPDLLLGCPLERAFVLWRGPDAELLSVQTQTWGDIAC